MEEDRNVALARAAAGHNALSIIADFGLTLGAAMLRAVTLAYLRALAAVEGWPAVLALIQQTAAENYVPPRGRKLTVVVSNETEVIKRTA